MSLNDIFYDGNTNYASMDIIRREINIIKEYYDINNLYSILDNMPMNFLILNSSRQVVYLNNSVMNIFKISEKKSALGKRLGDILSCVNTNESPKSCGNTENCNHCILLKSTLRSLKFKSTEEDITIITLSEPFGLNLHVWTNPLLINNKKFVAVTIKDKKKEKIKKDLDLIFFHDILNSFQGLISTIEILKKKTEDTDFSLIIEKLERIADRLSSEIKWQRILTKNENIKPELSLVNVKDILYQTIIDLNSDVQEFNFELDPGKILIKSDKTMIQRIITNMVKNA